MSQPDPARPYPEVPSQADFPALEQRIMEAWRKGRTFERSVEHRDAGAKGSNEYVFYDGPPFANGLPHYGHLVTGYVKDVVPRYQTMRGRRVERRFGWDCHGLPVEMDAERELGVSGRKAIEAYGVDRFNEHCRASVYRHTEHWVHYVARQGRWVDMKHDYKTLDLSYMESVLWAFKQLHEKGLLYEDHRVLAYSWAAETPVSNFEARLDDAYRERSDPAITVRFELVPEGEGHPVDLLAWTTTPWTLPSNLALAVGPDLDYAVYELEGRRVVLGAASAAKYEAELAGAERVATLRGSELVGRRYRALFPFFEGHPGAFRVLGADFVDVEEGTGVVHLAPGFGEDDMEVCRAAGIEAVVPVDESGRFAAPVEPWQGVNVFEANPGIIRALRERGALFQHRTYVHNYPHCWRTDQPLIYRAMNSWYVRVSALRERMVELNRRIHWIPEHVREGRFGKWLEGARDWSISRNRFWGAPIPVWKSDDPAHPRIDVYGSLDEIERDFGLRPDDLHRPAIDAFVRPNPDDPTGESTMRRVPDVLDCWFESGSMPFAHVHYPFEHREWFENHFPADFIVEYLAQTRGWFYTLMVLGTALFDRPPFKNVICHGVILAGDGQKLSKRKRNYTDPEEIFERFGSDALRWYLVSSPLLRGGDIRVADEPVGDVVKAVLNPIWSAYHFFTLYANADGVCAELRADAEAVLDRYALAKTRELVDGVTARLDDYDLAGACACVLAYLDALNNWYIRRSRERFWKAERDADKRDAYATLYTALVTLCRVAAPLLPFVTEAVHQGLTGEESVHLQDWPDPEALPSDPELVAAMDRVRDVCSTALALRRTRGVRVRQPLRRLTVAGAGAPALRPYLELMRDEVNVKEVELSEEIGDLASLRLQVNARALGPRLGPDTKKVIAASKAGRWRHGARGEVVVEGHVLGEGEFELLLVPADGVACQALSTRDMIAALDFDIDESLRREGLARDLVRVVQQARREAGLRVSDRIHLALALPDEWRRAVDANRDFVAEQTLADRLELVDRLPDALRAHESRVGDDTLRVGLAPL
jgi:isoleucyl-tRNA synthetase